MSSFRSALFARNLCFVLAFCISMTLSPWDRGEIDRKLEKKHSMPKVNNFYVEKG